MSLLLGSGAEDMKGKLDEGCYLGYAHCGTYSVTEDSIGPYVQIVECAAYPAFKEPVFSTGGIVPSIGAMCHLAICWLKQKASRFQGALLWPDISTVTIHFHFGPCGAANQEQHFGPTIYLALIAAATGWKMEKNVSMPLYHYHLIGTLVDLENIICDCCLMTGERVWGIVSWW